MKLASPAALITAAVVAASAHGAPIFPQASDYNVFTFGSASIANTSVGGRIAAGGSISLSGVGIGAALTNSRGQRDDIITAGAISMSNGSVANGNIRYAGAAAFRGVGIPNGSAYNAAAPFSFENARSEILALSSAWSELAVTGSTTVQWGGVNLVGTSSGLNVFSVSSAALQNANSFKISVPTGATVLINVDGAYNRMRNFGFNLNGAADDRILFNFFETTSLELGGIGVEGSILAPLASVRFQNGNIDGALIANTLTATGSFQSRPFTGALPQIPAPGAAVLAFLGLTIAGPRRRR